MLDDLTPAKHLVSAPLDMLARTDDVVFIHGNDRWTVARLAEAVDRLAAGMVAFGIVPGDRVALHLRNGPEIAIAYLACFRVGAVAAPLNTRFKQAELTDALGRLLPRAYLGQSELYPYVAAIDAAVLPSDARFLVDDINNATARHWSALYGEPGASLERRDADLNAPAVLLLTSGTTGQPKVVAHSLNTLTQIAERGAYLDQHAGQVLAFFLPMVHMSGLSTFLSSLRLRMRLVMCDAADPGSILAAVEEHRCDYLLMLPATATLLMEAQRRQPRNVSSLRLCLTAGDACPPGQQDAFRALFGRPLLSYWASTEAVGSFTYGLHPGAVSRLNPETELQLVNRHGAQVPLGEPGEMLLRGSNVMLGYWTAPGVLDGLDDGWYRSGDLMRQDPRGNVWFVTRLKDLIVRGGSNISPLEVENAITSHPAVEEAAVFGMPDVILGQRVMGFVRLSCAAGTDILPEILARSSSRLADYKVPERLLPIAAMPRNALGKINRQRLAAMAEELLASSSRGSTSALPHSLT